MNLLGFGIVQQLIVGNHFGRRNWVLWNFAKFCCQGTAEEGIEFFVPQLKSIKLRPIYFLVQVSYQN